MKNVNAYSGVSYTIHYTLECAYGIEAHTKYYNTEEETIKKVNSLLSLYSPDSFKKITWLEVHTIENFILN